MQTGDTLNMTPTETTLTLTPATLDMRVLATTADAVYLRLPCELQRPIEGGCQCEHCKKDFHATPAWDTLVVPSREAKAGASYFAWHTFTVHMPDGGVADFVAHTRRQEAAKRGA